MLEVPKSHVEVPHFSEVPRPRVPQSPSLCLSRLIGLMADHFILNSLLLLDLAPCCIFSRGTNIDLCCVRYFCCLCTSFKDKNLGSSTIKLKTLKQSPPAPNQVFMLLYCFFPVPCVCKLNKSLPAGPAIIVSDQKNPVLLYLQPCNPESLVIREITF